MTEPDFEAMARRFGDHTGLGEELVRHAYAQGRATREEKRAPVQGYSAGIPWAMHLRAYDAYCKKHGAQEALIEGTCRGGFAVGELDIFIPGWREELSQIATLTHERDDARAAATRQYEHNVKLIVEVAALEAQLRTAREALEDVKRYADDHDDEWVPERVDHALAQIDMGNER